jgi:hypothetical protein
MVAMPPLQLGDHVAHPPVPIHNNLRSSMNDALTIRIPASFTSDHSSSLNGNGSIAVSIHQC